MPAEITMHPWKYVADPFRIAGPPEEGNVGLYRTERMCLKHCCEAPVEVFRDDHLREGLEVVLLYEVLESFEL